MKFRVSSNKLLLFAVLFVLSTFVHAVPCDYIYSQYATKNAPLTDVVYGRDATVLHLSYPHVDRRKLDFTNMYLSDSKKNVYRLLRSEMCLEPQGEQGDSIWHIQLSFEPLVEGERVFDLLSSKLSDAHMCYWGIHSREDKIMLDGVEDTYKEYADSSLLRPGVAVIRGYFEDANSVFKESRRLTIKYNRFEPDDQSSVREVYVKDDGSFEISCKLDGHTCVFVEDSLRTFSFPVYLVPGGVTDVYVRNVGLPNQTIKYYGSNGCDTHEALMNAFCNTVITDGHPENREQFCEYMAKKYGLSAYERHLLLLELQGKVYDYKFSYIGPAFREKFCSTPEQYHDKVGLSAAIHSKEARELYAMLRDIDWQDMSLRVVPHQYYAVMIACLTPVRYSYTIGGLDEMSRTMEEYVGSPIGDGWKSFLRVISGEAVE